jgi:hypothetical protein
MSIQIEVADRDRAIERSDIRGVAFGESLGLDVPTQYTPEIHSVVNSMIAADAVLMPAILGMSARTAWLSRGLAALLWAFRDNSITDVPLRRRLEIEAGTGAILLLLGARGTVSRKPLDRLHLIFSGATLIANSFMTRVQDETESLEQR